MKHVIYSSFLFKRYKFVHKCILICTSRWFGCQFHKLWK